MLLITYDLLLIEKFNIPCRRFFQLENFYEFHKIENPIDHLSISALGTLLKLNPAFKINWCVRVSFYTSLPYHLLLVYHYNYISPF